MSRNGNDRSTLVRGPYVPSYLGRTPAQVGQTAQIGRCRPRPEEPLMLPALTRARAHARPCLTRYAGALMALALVTGAAAGAVAASPATAADRSTAAATGQPEDVPTAVRISSFNLLGYGHTAPGGERHGWASGTVR